ncbi:acylglycerol kinase, mitochondrial [Rhinoderma darwinii]|uniref:acylglycerol kinase, mitochondrial n=1 Tax=Rhinoderma darwinii TaxID=43563 RepID=UPI003F6804E5
MAKVVRLFKTLRNHWKKSTVGFCLLAYGSHWMYGKYCDNLLRRAACQEAQGFGNQLIYPHTSVKKATVFLNPAACKGRARSLFEKNAAPILHLAGIDVYVVKVGAFRTCKSEVNLHRHVKNAIFVNVSDCSVILRLFSEVFLKKCIKGPLEWPQRHVASILFLGPTDRPPDEEAQEIPGRPSLHVRIYRRLARYWSPPKVVEVAPEPWEEIQLSAVELSINTQNHQPDLTRPLDSMSVCIEPDAIRKSEFISLGVEKIEDPKLCHKDAQILHVSRCNIQLPEGTEGHFSIDSEEYDAMSVEVTLLPRKLRLLCHPSQKEKFTQHSTASS